MSTHTLAETLTGGFDGGHAHMSLDEAVADFPASHYNARARNVPYTFWHLLEHVRITARDLLDYIEAEDYTEGEWPADYWPANDAEADEAAWNATLEAIRTDEARLKEIAGGSEESLAALAKHAGDRPDHTVARCIRVVFQHGAYHTGEFAILRQVEDLWPEGHE